MTFFRRIFGFERDRVEFFSCSEKKADSHGIYEVICPYCFNVFSHEEIEFRSSNGNIMEVDKNRKSFDEAISGQTLSDADYTLPRILKRSDAGVKVNKRSAKGVVTSCIEESAWQYVTTEMVCPHCHGELPLDSGEVPSYLITILGNTFVGKTVYLARIFQDFVAQAANLGFAATPYGSAEDLISKRYEEAIAGQGINATPIEKQEPIIYHISRNGKSVCNLIFYDFPGEITGGNQNQFLGSLKGRNISNSDGFLVMYSFPSIDPVLKAQIPKKDLGQDDGISATKVFNFLTKYFGDGNLFDKPTAMVMSKADLLGIDELEQYRRNNKIGPNSYLFNNKDIIKAGETKMDPDYFYQVNCGMKSILPKQIQVNFNNFTRVGSFAVSATGTPVTEGEINNVAAPLNIYWPFIWLMAQFGVLKEDGFKMDNFQSENFYW